MKSILQVYKNCYICGRTDALESHHIFGGPNRELSEKYGLKVYLCHWCHNEPPDGAHFNAATMKYLHSEGQKAFEETYGSREKFMKEFGRNYL